MTLRRCTETPTRNGKDPLALVAARGQRKATAATRIVDALCDAEERVGTAAAA
jgi:hypothetical protein